MKPWRVIDTYTGADEDFATEAEALAFAETALSGYREEAIATGEWESDVEHLAIYEARWSAKPIVETADGVDYGILPVAP